MPRGLEEPTVVKPRDRLSSVLPSRNRALSAGAGEADPPPRRELGPPGPGRFSPTILVVLGARFRLRAYSPAPDAAGKCSTQSGPPERCSQMPGLFHTIEAVGLQGRRVTAGSPWRRPGNVVRALGGEDVAEMEGNLRSITLKNK
ncbi:uncharacterized protein WM277_005842 [Molossus nigricans]